MLQSDDETWTTRKKEEKNGTNNKALSHLPGMWRLENNYYKIVLRYLKILTIFEIKSW